MYWETMREEQFTQELANNGCLCALPISSLEKHGQHLPVGTDGYILDAVIAEALKIEDTVIFPTSCWLGDISAPVTTSADGKPRWRGAIELDADLQLTLLENLCDEIRRNGFRKILLIAKQPATAAVLSVLLRQLGYNKRDYAIMTTRAINPTVSTPARILETVTARRSDFPMITDEDLNTLAQWATQGVTAAAFDTALMLACQETLVAQNRYPTEKNRPAYSLDTYHADTITFSGIQNLQYPNIACADVPQGCTKSIGQAILKINAEHLAAIFRLLKEDEKCLAIVNRKTS